MWMLDLIFIYSNCFGAAILLKGSLKKQVKRICCHFILTKQGKFAIKEKGIETIEYVDWVLAFIAMPFNCLSAIRDYKVSINCVIELCNTAPT